MSTPTIPLAAQSWRSRALCDGDDTERWFPVGGGDADPYVKAVCAACPVRGECLDFAIATRQCGVWGGMTEAERYAERRRRQRRGAAA